MIEQKAEKLTNLKNKVRNQFPSKEAEVFNTIESLLGELMFHLF